VNVSVGQTVNAGDTIGFVGSTGKSTGAHLHLTLYIKGVLADPLPYLKSPS
jgi:murein DD-endopeptidase MepM/ murein hydrolase activator NlpD